MHGVVQPPPPRSPEPSVAPQRSPPPRTPTARPSPGPGTVAVTAPRTSGERHRTALDLHQTRVLSVTSRSAPRGQGSTSRLLRPTGAHCKSHGFSFPISQVRGPLESIFCNGTQAGAGALFSHRGVPSNTLLLPRGAVLALRPQTDRRPTGVGRTLGSARPAGPHARLPAPRRGQRGAAAESWSQVVFIFSRFFRLWF